MDDPRTLVARYEAAVQAATAFDLDDCSPEATSFRIGADDARAIIMEWSADPMLAQTHLGTILASYALHASSDARAAQALTEHLTASLSGVYSS